MQLINNALYAITVLATIAAAVPSPIVARGEKFAVFNGEKSVMPNPPRRPATFWWRWPKGTSTAMALPFAKDSAGVATMLIAR
jgi:hypothetical protein